MNKNIYIYLVMKSSTLCKCHIFYPSKQSITITNNGETKGDTASKTLLDTLDYIIRLKINLPIILVTDQVIITNAVNERKMNDNKFWSPVINKINNFNLDIISYTSD